MLRERLFEAKRLTLSGAFCLYLIIWVLCLQKMLVFPRNGVLCLRKMLFFPLKWGRDPRKLLFIQKKGTKLEEVIVLYPEL